MPTGRAGVQKGNRQAAFWGVAGWRMAGLTAAIVLSAIAPRSAHADDMTTCNTQNFTPDQELAACERLIASGKYRGEDLANRYVDRGVAFHRKGDADHALADDSQAIALAPKLGVAYLNRGNLWLEKKQYDSAQADYDKAISFSTGPNLALAYGGRGKAWHFKGNLDQALTDLDHALAINPQLISALEERGLTRLAKNALDGALADFNKVIELDPRNADGHNNRAVVLDRQNNRDHAIEDYGQAIALRPTFTLAYRNRARAFMAQGKLNTALDDLNQALTLDPKYIDAYNDRAELRSRQADWDAVVADEDHILAIDPKNFTARYRRGVAWERKGYTDRKNGSLERGKQDLEEALRDFDQAIAINPKSEIAYLDRGNTQLAKGDVDGSIASYGAAISANPNYAIAYGNRCNVLRRNPNDNAAALADCAAAIRLDPGFTAAYSYRGQIFENRGDTASAIAEYTKAATLPIKFDTGQAMHDFAQARLAVLAPGGAKPPVTTAGPASTPPSASSGGRLALVMDNGSYAPPNALDNPPNDARAVAKVLRDIGFEVIEGINLDHAGMMRSLQAFLSKVAYARVALLYYAGHGVQIRGQNYLVPTDAKMQSEATVELELVNLDKQVLDGLNDESRANIVILDACRTNPFANAGKRGRGASGLAIPATGGSLVAFATDPNNVAADGEGTVHSPYTTALLQYISDPNLDLVTMLRRVQQAVRTATHGEQNPYITLPPFADVYLARDPKRTSAN